MQQSGDNYLSFATNTNGGQYGMSFQRQGNGMQHPLSAYPCNQMANEDPGGRNGEYFRFGESGLNVSDPRYAAKYGNPYLREPRNLEINGVRRGAVGNELGRGSSSPMQSPQRVQNAMGGGSGRQYATLNTRNGRPYSPNSSLYKNNQGYGTMQQKPTMKNQNREKFGGPNSGNSLLTNVLAGNAKMVGNTTLNSATSAAAVANKYIGTMLGNGIIARPNTDIATNSIRNKVVTSQGGAGTSSGSHLSSSAIHESSGYDRNEEERMAQADNGENSRQGGVGVGSEASHYILSPNGEAASQAGIATHV